MCDAERRTHTEEELGCGVRVASDGSASDYTKRILNSEEKVWTRNLS